ncbi:MAG: hypothetical protein AB7J30_07435 [Hyphomicrobium sp.]|uniref:hypothetical protein n=1 Tax=Hyphomicrobium sp. TaxID=82 RepID=UPI003D0F6B60
MTALVTLLRALAGGIIGWILAAALTMWLGGYFGLSDFEGERDMTAAFGIGPMGGLIGVIVGLWLSPWRRRVR